MTNSRRRRMAAVLLAAFVVLAAILTITLVDSTTVQYLAYGMFFVGPARRNGDLTGGGDGGHRDIGWSPAPLRPRCCSPARRIG